jgi:hypothetical protein
MPLPAIKKILQTQDKYIYPMGFDMQIARKFNSGDLSYYMGEMIAEPVTTEQKIIYNHLRMMLKNLKKQRR